MDTVRPCSRQSQRTVTINGSDVLSLRAAKAIALADVYVTTKRIRDLLEWRLEAIQQALAVGATQDDLERALDGADLGG